MLRIVDILLQNNNYNSGYAAYCSLSNGWLSNIYNVINIKLAGKYDKIYKNYQNLFKLQNNCINLKNSMNESLLPNCLFFGTYQQELVYICQMEKTFTKEQKININKFNLINEVIKRMIGSNQYPYDYKKNDNILSH